MSLPCCEVNEVTRVECCRRQGHEGGCSTEPCLNNCQSGAQPGSDVCSFCIATWRSWATGTFAPAAYDVPITAWELLRG